MMEYSLEDDIPEEFKGGTLQFNNEDKNKSTDNITLPNDNSSPKTNDKSLKDPLIDKVDNNSLNLENNNGVWKTNIMVPLSELTECIWSKKAIDKTKDETTKDVQPTLASLVEENANNYFTFRHGVIENAVKECSEQLVDSQTDGPLLNVFLLTEINFWDTDKERLILLTPYAVIVIKYDFIALKRIDFKKISLKDVDSVLIGDLVYPKKSLVPRIYGIADGMSTLVQNILFQSWSKNDKGFYALFQSRNRNMIGLRLLWNKNNPITFGTKWNPFTNKIPFATFTSHPLLYHKDCVNEKQQSLFDVTSFTEAICNAITDLELKKTNESPCIIHHKEIVLENYCSIGSIIHNRNALGYFKVRGKFSF